MKPKKANVAIISVNYNNSRLTEDLINSYSNQKSKNTKTKLIIVDNGSTEKSSQTLGRRFKNIEFIKLKKNLGFAGGNNVGIKKAIKDGADYILLINNDAEFLTPNSMDLLVKGNKGISAPVVKFLRNNEPVFDYGGRIDKVFGRNTHYESPFAMEDFYPKADYYSGVCLMIKSQVFEKVGFLDETFFLYYEDVDFCLRAKKAGFKLNLNPDVMILHKLSSSTNKLGRKKIQILADSHFNFCLKHLPPLATPFFLAFNVYLRLKSYS